MKYFLIIIVLIFSILGGIYLKKEKFGSPVQTFTYQNIQWKRPLTDAQWNDDVKKEQIDYRSTEVLEQMLKSHQDKVEKLRPQYDKWVQCPECKRWEFKEQFKGNGMTDQEIEAEYQSQLKTALEDWERLNRAVERIAKELELRQKGYVIIAGESEKVGGQMPENRIRHIRE